MQVSTDQADDTRCATRQDANAAFRSLALASPDGGSDGGSTLHNVTLALLFRSVMEVVQYMAVA